MGMTFLERLISRKMSMEDQMLRTKHSYLKPEIFIIYKDKLD